MTSRLPLCALAPAKINLGLFVGPVRADGRHELVSVMQSISLADELALEPVPGGTSDELLCPGAPGLERQNIAAKALADFRVSTAWDPGPLRLTILKHVPVAAGLGGGSGDAAATLRLASHASGVEDPALLQRLAAGLGADVPAQVQPGRWLALGAGERLFELPSAREPFGVLVLPVDAQLSTAAVYAEADRLARPRSDAELRELAHGLRAGLAHAEQLPSPELLTNDLQAAALSLCPQIGEMLARARGHGADVALVSGSGPTVLGLFAGVDGPARARVAAHDLAESAPVPIAAVPVDACFGHAHDIPVRNNADS